MKDWLKKPDDHKARTRFMLFSRKRNSIAEAMHGPQKKHPQYGNGLLEKTEAKADTIWYDYNLMGGLTARLSSV